MNKTLLRNNMLTQLTNINEKEYDRLSLIIKDRVVASTVFQQAETIGLTISRFPEVNTRLIIEAAWALGKRVVVPKCSQQTREMDFRLISSYDDLEVSYAGLLEPTIKKTVSITKKAIDLQVVPGVLYSDEGYRIGFGGGYYDKYLAGFTGHTMSLAFSCQTRHTIPVEVHDIPVSSIVTERGIILCTMSGGSK